MSTAPIVSTAAGSIRGSADNGIYAFKGVPFAEPPVGANRFAPPVPRKRWDGVRDAVEFGPTCWQGPSPLPGMIVPIPPGDDCLSLNVWTPDPSPGARLPVFVWIHGGAFVFGAGSEPLYEGSSFARDNVVCVTVNYRLGADGYHFAGDAPGSGNFGTLDQIAALRWVQDNVEAFGGDPANVTIAGESAGGMSVGTLLAAPGARGLYRRAIPQSGSIYGQVDADTARSTAEELCRRLGVGNDLAALRAVTSERLIEVQALLYGEQMAGGMVEGRLGGLTWAPVHGTETLPQDPAAAIAAGSAQGVDVLVGTTAEEGLLFTALMPQLFTEEVVSLMAKSALGDAADAALTTYRANRPGAGGAHLASAVMTDLMFRMPSVRLAETLATQGHPAHVYQFSWPSKAFDGALGACHALELPFVFETLDAPAAQFLTGGDAPVELAREVHRTWVRFATDGRCDWPAYTPTNRVVRDFNVPGGVLVDPNADERALWSR